MDIHERIDEFERLEEGWNGYNAPPIPKSVVKRSRRFANALEREEAGVFPTGRETIQFEFENIEVEIFETFVEILHESTFGDEPNVFSLTLEEAIEKYTTGA